MDAQRHWENIYGKKAADAVSWYRPHLEISLELIERAAPELSASIIDIGGGESTLVDDLLARGYRNISVLDISQTAVDANKKRLGPASEHIHWLVADITKATLESCAYDVWHDRAVFHFLTSSEERVAYVRQVANAVKPGGHVIVSTFGPEGPTKCSGLDVVRYDAKSLHREFGVRFRLLGHSKELHRTPFRYNPTVSLLFLQGGMKEILESPTRIVLKDSSAPGQSDASPCASGLKALPD